MHYTLLMDEYSIPDCGDGDGGDSGDGGCNGGDDSNLKKEGDEREYSMRNILPSVKCYHTR